MKAGIGFLVVLLLTSVGFTAQPRVVVLIPGFFNSLAQPYFSPHIVSFFERKGFHVEQPKNLNPIGGVEQNSQLVLQFLRKLNKKLNGEAITVIGHSLGGIYTLKALNADRTLNVKNVVTLATPYLGVGIIEGIDRRFPGLADLADFFNLESLTEMRASNVAAILRKNLIPSGVRWIALGGYEKKCLMLSCSWADRLSWIMSVSQFFIGSDPSDGIVTLDSALATSTKLKIERWTDSVPLEHWEMVLDHEVFSLLGVGDTNWIYEQQIQLYQNILNRL